MVKEQLEEGELELYNEDQKWWDTVKQNSDGAIEQFKNSIKLQEALRDLAITNIEELAD